jgi:putative transposase
LVAQQARQLSWSLAHRASPPRFLIYDRDSKFSGAFDDVFRSARIEIVRTPIQAPQANAFARALRRHRAARMPRLDPDRRPPPARARLHTYVDHYNGHRPHRGLGLVAPQPRPGPRLAAPPDSLRVRRPDRLGGLIHEYSAAA